MEVWKPVKHYEGFYEVSSLGRVKSLSKIFFMKGKYLYKSKERILNGSIDDGYLKITLSKKGKRNTKKAHQLVAIAFLDHKTCKMELVVNHKNFNRADNRVENLEIVTNRENCNQKHLKSSSKYVGVHYYKSKSKWSAYIYINGKQKHLGYFLNELDASEAYQTELNFLKLTKQ